MCQIELLNKNLFKTEDEGGLWKRMYNIVKPGQVEDKNKITVTSKILKSWKLASDYNR